MSKIAIYKRLVWFWFVPYLFFFGCFFDPEPENDQILSSKINQKRDKVVSDSQPTNQNLFYADKDEFIEIRDRIISTASFTAHSNISDLKQRGEYLVNNVASCKYCHGDKSGGFSGGKKLSINGTPVKAPDITGDLNNGVGRIKSGILLNSIRLGYSKKQVKFSENFHSGFDNLSNLDAEAIIAYLKTQNRSAVQNDSSGTKHDIVVEDKDEAEFYGYIPSLFDKTQKSSADYGYYLVNSVSNCVSCHSDKSEFNSKEDSVLPPLKARSFSKIFERFNVDEKRAILNRYFEKQISSKGKQIDPKYCPVDTYSKMQPLEKDSIIKYLERL